MLAACRCAISCWRCASTAAAWKPTARSRRRCAAEVAPDGTPEIASGHFMMVERLDQRSRRTRTAHVPIDRAEMTVDWSNAQHALAMPFQLVSGRHAFHPDGAGRSAARYSPASGCSASPGARSCSHRRDPRDEPVLLNRIMVRGRFDPVAQRLKIEQGEASGKDAGLAMSGMLDFSTPDPRLAIGLASRNMTFAAFKQLWPPFINPPVRQWVMERVSGGIIEQGEIATNAPMSTLRNGGPPVPDDGLSIQIVTSGSTVRPFDDLPEIRDADLVTRIKGRSATVSLGRGTVEMPSGRRLTMANGVFEVPETLGDHPPARVRTRIEGPVAAAVDLLNMDRLKGHRRRPARPGDDPRQHPRDLQHGDAARRGDQGRHHHLFRHRRHRELRGRSVPDVAEGRGADVARLRQQPGLPDPRRHAHRRRAGDRGDAPQRRRIRRRGQAAGDARRRRAHPPRLGHHGKSQRTGDAQGRRQSRSRRRPGEQARGRGGLRPGQGREPAAGLGQAGEPAGARDLHLCRRQGAGPAASTTSCSTAAARRSAAAPRPTPMAISWSPTSRCSGCPTATRRRCGSSARPDNLYKATVRGDVYDGRSFIKSSMAGSGADAKQKKPGTGCRPRRQGGQVRRPQGRIAAQRRPAHDEARRHAARALAQRQDRHDGTLTGEMRGRPSERPGGRHRIQRRRRRCSASPTPIRA